MFAAVRVEAFARLRCARCGEAFAIIGERADAIIYRLLFGGLKPGDIILAACQSCKSESVAIEHADYILPTFVK